MNDSISKSTSKTLICIVGLGAVVLLIVTVALQLLYKQVDLEVHSLRHLSISAAPPHFGLFRNGERLKSPRFFAWTVDLELRDSQSGEVFPIHLGPGQSAVIALPQENSRKLIPDTLFNSAQGSYSGKRCCMIDFYYLRKSGCYWEVPKTFRPAPDVE